MKRDVRFTSEAEQCVRDILNWLAERSVSGAISWHAALEAVYHQLEQRAESFGLAPESDQFHEPLHQALFKTRRGRTYRALIVIRGPVVHVVSVRGAGQTPVDPATIVMPE